MNRYQVVMPNGDILAICAEKLEDVDGSLNFTNGSEKVGEVTKWIGWSLVGPVEPPLVAPLNAPVIQHNPSYGG